MKFEIPSTTIERIVENIAAAARGILRHQIDALHEQELISQLRSATTLDAKEKIVAYLGQSRSGLSRDENVVWITVESEYLRQHLAIPTLMMKAVRDELEEEGEIVVDRKSHRPIVIRHVQSD